MNNLVISEIKIKPVNHPNNKNHKADVSIVLNDCLVIRSIAIIETSEKRFIGFPSYLSKKNNTFVSLVNPITSECRNWFEKFIFEKYDELITLTDNYDKENNYA